MSCLYTTKQAGGMGAKKGRLPEGRCGSCWAGVLLNTANPAGCLHIAHVGCGGQEDAFPWDKKFDKRGKQTRIRELVKAGALIAAEIDRLQRLKK